MVPRELCFAPVSLGRLCHCWQLCWRSIFDRIRASVFGTSILDISEQTSHDLFFVFINTGWLRNPAPVGRLFVPLRSHYVKSIKKCFIGIPIVTNWCRISQPSTVCGPWPTTNCCFSAVEVLGQLMDVVATSEEAHPGTKTIQEDKKSS